MKERRDRMAETNNLNMSNATYARSVSGRKKLENDFLADIENLTKILNGDKYTSLKKTVKANWVGADADDFLADIEKSRKALETNLKTLKSKFNSAVAADAKQFSSFQNKNVE